MAHGAPDSGEASSQVAGSPLESPFDLVALSTMRRTIGSRLQQSKQSAPHFYLAVEIDLGRLQALREQIKASSLDGTPSVNDFVVRACGLALEAHPAINASVDDGRLKLYRHVNVGVAVALPAGLVVPVVREVDRRDIFDIAREVRALVERARANKLTPDDYRGGTFTVSNLGGFGVRSFTAILNPPQAAILALGRAEPRAVVRDGQVVPALQMTATLSVDHRVADGGVAAAFLAEVQRLLESPDEIARPPRTEADA